MEFYFKKFSSRWLKPQNTYSLALKCTVSELTHLVLVYYFEQVSLTEFNIPGRAKEVWSGS